MPRRIVVITLLATLPLLAGCSRYELAGGERASVWRLDKESGEVCLFDFAFAGPAARSVEARGCAK